MFLFIYYKSHATSHSVMRDAYCQVSLIPNSIHRLILSQTIFQTLRRITLETAAIYNKILKQRPTHFNIINARLALATIFLFYLAPIFQTKVFYICFDNIQNASREKKLQLFTKNNGEKSIYKKVNSRSFVNNALAHLVGALDVHLVVV